jgi:glycosyltransferase involved in cell wall biosynthesis
VKVLVISNLFPPDIVGGYELGCSQAVEAIRASGIDVRVLTSAPRVPVPNKSHIHRSLQLSDNWSPTLNSSRTPLLRELHIMRSYHINALNNHVLQQQLESFQPDVVYLWSLEGIGGLGLLGCLHYLRIPWVWHLMDAVPALVCSDAHGPIPGLIRAYNAQIRGSYLSCSQTVLDEIASCGVLLADDVELVPNWVHGPQSPVRSEYRTDGSLRIMHAAAQVSIGCDKGTDLIVRAAALLRDQGHSRFQIDIYGNAPDRSIADLIVRHNLHKHVQLMGWREQRELKALHPTYDLFAFPTRTREPFAFAPLEASAAGCVPLISEVCGNSEWFVHGIHLLKTPRTPDAIASELAAVLNGKVNLKAIGRRGAAVVRRDFHLDAIAPTIIRTLQRAATRSRAGAGHPSDAYRLAMMAERMTQVSIYERVCA